jgi:serine/threonine-protein kinase
MGEDLAKTVSPPGLPRVGEIVAGKFRIERMLGEGGMAHVVEATHLLLDERVALKFLRAEVLLRSDIVARFAQEGRAAAKLKSEHVARVIDVGELGTVPYIVMEYLDGQNLEEVVAERGPLPIAEAVDLLIQACEGITDAHARGIIHRDIKPANLFLTQRDGWPTLKILDFGISKAALTPSPSPFALGGDPVNTLSLLGSPHYMSPEQLRSTKDVDRRTDIWSLGVVLFELLTGRTAFVATDFLGLAREIFETPHTPLRTLRPDAPAELEAVIDRALAKNAEARFQSAGELALMLLEFTASKRSRVIATRAISVTQKAEIDVNLPLPSAAPSASSGQRLLDIPGPPRVPAIDAPATGHAPTVPAPSGAVPAGALSDSRAHAPAVTLAASASTASRGRFVAPLVALVIGLSVGIGALVFVRTREPAALPTERSSAPVVVASAATPPAASLAVAVAPAASASAPPAPVEKASRPAASASTAPVTTKAGRPTTSPATTRATAPSAKPSADAPPEWDIRRTR